MENKVYFLDTVSTETQGLLETQGPFSEAEIETVRKFYRWLLEDNEKLVVREQLQETDFDSKNIPSSVVVEANIFSSEKGCQISIGSIETMVQKITYPTNQRNWSLLIFDGNLREGEALLYRDSFTADEFVLYFPCPSKFILDPNIEDERAAVENLKVTTLRIFEHLNKKLSKKSWFLLEKNFNYNKYEVKK